jgi:PleD family two-component response regulator
MMRARANIDLVLLDLGLPDGDGETCCSKTCGAGRATPVIVISARHCEDPKIRLLDAGADDYLVKPFGLASCWRACAWPCVTAAPRCNRCSRTTAHGDLGRPGGTHRVLSGGR